MRGTSRSIEVAVVTRLRPLMLAVNLAMSRAALALIPILMLVVYNDSYVDTYNYNYEFVIDI